MSMDSVTVFRSSGIIVMIDASVTTVSCTRLSIRGLASAALTGVTRSTHRDDSRVVRNGIRRTNSLRSRYAAYVRMSCSYVILSGPPISKIRPAVSSFLRQPTRYATTSSTAIGWAYDPTHEGQTITFSLSTRYRSIVKDPPYAPMIMDARSSVTGMLPDARISPTSFLLFMWGDRPESSPLTSPPR